MQFEEMKPKAATEPGSDKSSLSAQAHRQNCWFLKTATYVCGFLRNTTGTEPSPGEQIFLAVVRKNSKDICKFNAMHIGLHYKYTSSTR